MFPAKLLPELEADLIAALAQLEHDHFTRHFSKKKKNE
jgi:hypothetical protein